MSEVTFRVRLVDLERGVKQLLANRDKNAAGDFADVLVSECVATLRTVGSSTEIPVAGTAPGAARVPVSCFEEFIRQSRTFHQREIEISISPGVFKIGSWRQKYPDISLGTIPDQAMDLPVNASVLDTLALAEIMTDEQISRQGLGKRLNAAKESAASAIKKATAALAPLEIAEEQVQELVQQHVQATSRNLARLLRRGAE